MRHIAALFLLVLVSACATVPPPAPQPSLVWRQEGTTSYESRSPGLGISHRYVSASGWIDVYVYSLRRSNWAPGVGDAQFSAHFQSTIDEVRAFERRGAYAGVTVSAARDVTIAGQRFRTVNFRYAREGKPLLSATYLTARNGRLLKYRVSIEAASGLDVDTVAQQFIEENLRNDPSATRV